MVAWWWLIIVFYAGFMVGWIGVALFSANKEEENEKAF